MKLHLPLLLEHLESRDFALLLPDGLPHPIPAKHKTREAIWNRLGPKLHEAQKYIFDSGSDQDKETTDAFRQSAVALMEHNLFHLPFPVIWIEDPFDDATVPNRPSGDEDVRNYYLCVEEPEYIEITAFMTLPRELGEAMTLGRPKDRPRFSMVSFQMRISLIEPSDQFRIVMPPTHQGGVGPMFQQACQEAVYAVKKFLVSISIADTVRERHPGKPFKASLPKKHREYPYTIVRIPEERLDPGEQGTGTGKSGRRRPRRRLVAGYTWGRNTRPIEERRLIAPYWRGTQVTQEVEVEPDRHYEVKAKSGAAVKAAMGR